MTEPTPFLQARAEAKREAERAFAQAQAARPTASTHDPAPPRERPARTLERRSTVRERQAASIAASAARVAALWPTVEGIASVLARPTLRAAARRDGGRGSDRPDPTASIALDRERYDELADAIAADLVQWKWIEDRIDQYLKLDPEITKYAREHVTELSNLCVETGCDFTAERRRRCWKHYRELLEHEGETDPDAQVLAHPSTLALPSAATQAQSTHSTVTCMTCGTDYPLPAGADALAWLADHHAEQHPETATA